MYQFESRVRYSETDSNGNMTLQEVLDYFQDCSSFQSEELGVGIDYLMKKRMVWVLNSWQIVVKRYPHMGEEIVIGTAPYDLKGCFGYRNFFMKTKDGEELAYANSLWTLLNMDKGLPEHVTQEMTECYIFSEKYPMEYAPRKIALPKALTAGEEIVVRPHHLDTNHHVNNGQYVRMAMDLIRAEQPVTQLRAEYRKSAVLGDTIYPYLAQDMEKHTCLVSLCDKQKQPYAIIELTY